MKISVVTPCYNMERYIEKTMESVLSQKYGNLEYIVIDGGSNDDSVEHISRYIDRLSLFIQEPDDGQYHAIQKGFEQSTGEVMGWINADDIYMPWALSVVSEIFSKYPHIDWITGLPSFINDRDQITRVYSSVACYPRKHIREGWYRDHLAGYLQQESMFWRRSLWENAGGLDLSLDFAADFKLWTEFAKYAELIPVSIPLAAFRRRPGLQRSCANRAEYTNEVREVCLNLRHPPLVWESISRRGVLARSICRLAIWGRTNALIYSDTLSEWVLSNHVRPLSRVSFGDLVMEFFKGEHASDKF